MGFSASHSSRWLYHCSTTLPRPTTHLPLKPSLRWLIVALKFLIVCLCRDRFFALHLISWHNSLRHPFPTQKGTQLTPKTLRIQVTASVDMNRHVWGFKRVSTPYHQIFHLQFQFSPFIADWTLVFCSQVSSHTHHTHKVIKSIRHCSNIEGRLLP